MHEWSITDGPGTLATEDAGSTQAFTIVLDDGTTAQAQIHLTFIGEMFHGAVRSFAGTMAIGQHHFSLIGTYNTRDRAGHCHTAPES